MSAIRLFKHSQIIDNQAGEIAVSNSMQKLQYLTENMNLE